MKHLSIVLLVASAYLALSALNLTDAKPPKHHHPPPPPHHHHPPPHHGPPSPPPPPQPMVSQTQYTPMVAQTHYPQLVSMNRMGEYLPEEGHGESHAMTWSYNDQRAWKREYPECRGRARRQSPINIQTENVIFRPSIQIELVNYDQPVEFQYKNTHHSVSLSPVASNDPPSVRANWVERGETVEYELIDIHFHWGDGINKGSEHEINGQRAAAEMHMVHLRKGVDKAQAGSTNNSLLVIGVFIETDAFEHNKLEALVRSTSAVNGTDKQYHDYSQEVLMDLLPENHHSFYTYEGSLTTPPCSEVVTWVVMSEPVYMSQDMLVELSNFEVEKPDHKTEKINANYRHVQPLKGRRVYASFNLTESTSLSQPNRQIAVPGGNLANALDRYRPDRVTITIRRPPAAVA